MNATIVKLPRLYYGYLLVTAFTGKDSRGEATYSCACACGASVKRTRSQLTIRRLGSCDKCRVAIVEDKVAARAEDRAKDRRKERKHADDQPDDQGCA